MVIRDKELKRDLVNCLNGGRYETEVKHLMDADNLCGRGSYDVLIIPPGGSVGYYEHPDEMVSYYILSGRALFNDNRHITGIHEGDITRNEPGQGHAIDNVGIGNLVVVRLTLKKNY